VGRGHRPHPRPLVPFLCAALPTDQPFTPNGSSFQRSRGRCAYRDLPALHFARSYVGGVQEGAPVPRSGAQGDQRPRGRGGPEGGKRKKILKAAPEVRDFLHLHSRARKHPSLLHHAEQRLLRKTRLQGRPDPGYRRGVLRTSQA